MAIPSTLIIGYGNPDRQDDGVAWHVLESLSTQLKIERPDPDSGDFSPLGGNPDLLFALQLTPEMAEIIANYERVCFVDAHTGQIAEDITIREILPEYQASPLTHHMTPQTLLSLVESMFRKKPQAILASIRGYEFGFGRALSERSKTLVQTAAAKICAWFQTNNANL